MRPDPPPDAPAEAPERFGPARGHRNVRRIALAAAIVAGAAVAVMTGDYVVELAGAGPARSRIEQLEAAVKLDSSAAKALEDERKLQTDASLAREGRGRVLAWVVLVAGGLALGCATWTVARRPQRGPALDTLVAVRFAPSRSARAAHASHEPRKDSAGPSAAAPDIDLGYVDDLVKLHGRDPEAAIPILQAIQARWRYLPDEALRRVCALTEITPAQLAGTSSFYVRFRRAPVGRHVVRVCHGTACHVAGATRIMDELRRHLRIAPGEDTDAQRRFTLDEVACVGCCSLAPVMMVEEETAGRLTPASARHVLDHLEPAP